MEFGRNRVRISMSYNDLLLSNCLLTGPWGTFGIMSLRAIYGHETVLHRLAGTLAASRFPQTALFVGPSGVGKQRLALWVAQGLLCDEGAGAACGSCGACGRTATLSHPDLHWFVPIPRPKVGDPDKQVEEAREALGEALAERRNGFWRPPDGMASHGLASVRWLQRVVGLTPFVASRKVIVVGDAERLVVQEASPEAANALLKVLEEPPANTTVILTAADAQALLPTIRSRVVPLRVPRVADEAVREFLSREPEPPLAGVALDRRVLLAEGSIGRALWADDDSGADRAGGELLAAIRTGPTAWLPQVLAQRPWAARGDYSATLDALAVRLRAELERSAAEGGERVPGLVEGLRQVEEARATAQGNVNPQLGLAVLARELERVL